MALENLKKHVGVLANTGVRVAVVFRKIPNDDTHCLLVETERLPDSYHDFLIQCLNSKESMETNEFYEVLNRRTFPDGLPCLQALHQKAYLRKEPIKNVMMIPLPAQRVPLELINATIDKKIDEYKARQNSQTPVDLPPIPDKAGEKATNVMQDPAALAKGLLLQAELLEEDANKKREEAYALAPELKPSRGRPALPEEIKAEKLEERKTKRRERDQRKAVESKIEKAEAVIDAKVAAKLKRDAERLSS